MNLPVKAVHAFYERLIAVARQYDGEISPCIRALALRGKILPERVFCIYFFCIALFCIDFFSHHLLAEVSVALYRKLSVT